MAAEVRSLEHELDASRGTVRGRVRITAPDEVIARWLIPHLGRLRARCPDLQVELFGTSSLVDLSRGEADVAVRLVRPKEADLRIKRLAQIELVLAGTAELAARAPKLRPVVLHGFLHYEGPENRRLRTLAGPLVASATSVSLLFQLVEMGIGVSAVPRVVAESAGLVILDTWTKPRTLWRASPEALSEMPRIQAVTDWLDLLFEEEQG